MPKNSQELHQILVDRGLYPNDAAANGDLAFDGYTLLKESGQWLVFISNRGQEHDVESFKSEEAAVRRMVERMRNDVFRTVFFDIE